MKPSDTSRFARARVIMRDAASGRWLRFTRPERFVTARTLADVAPGLRRVEEAVTRDGLYAAGFVSYEAAPAFDSSLVVTDDGHFPLLWFGLYQGIEEVELPAAGALRNTNGAPTSSRLCVAADPSGTAGFAATQSRLEVGAPDWQPSVGKEEFHREMARIKALIRSGDTYQVNYTYRLRTQFAGNPWNFFLRLVAAQDPPYGAFLDTGEWVICSASPELFFRLDGTRIECRPMKGTAARGRTQAEDRAQARALRASEKERAENVMIVDMVRHDLGRVAQTGTVNVTRLFEVEKYPTIWQMTSTIEAKTGAGLGEIFRALFPAASVTGAPKVRTMEIIAGLEPLPRRLYTGTIGFFAPGRRAQFNVAIRTLLANRKDGCAEYGVGSGITWDSDPEAEWRECGSKARILAPRVPPFSLLETMRWTPEEGYYLLERHLARLQDSALYFGFRLDLRALRLELERLSPGFGRKRRRIRLLVTKEGRITLEAKALPMNLVCAKPLSRIPPLPFQRGEGRGEGSIPPLGAWSQPTAKQPSSLPKATAKPHRIALARAPVDSSNPFLYHKTTNRTVYEAAAAACPGFDDVLLFNEQGEITESTIANIAVDIAGKLYTPPVFCGLLPGTLRAHLLQQGSLVERPITVAELLRSPRVFLLNSVRGIYPVEVVRAGQA
jgi:para-aminobenzoate synthetase / 4-amino-4-deoxychorismate lyase